MPEIKHLPLDSYYRAYREYTDTLKNVGQYGNLKTSLRNSAKKDQDTFSGSIAHKVIDMEWVEEIERTIPYIDKAIREQRRFISQSDEIVPIEKSKKITTESVRHLAQHTNMIGRVESDNTVTPKRILNIVREESFAIYENRFLRTLIMRAIDFVNRCYNQVKDTPESSVASIAMERDSVTDGQTFNVTLHCDLEYLETYTDFDVYGDVSGLTEFERVVRLRKILSDFLAAPLIKDLAGTPEVRSPVTRTNLLTKDQNFRETLKLWEFLDRYNKIGFSLIIEENPEKMKTKMQDGIYDVFTMLQFVMKMNLSDEMRNTLEAHYQAENARREEERRLEEEAREREVKKRISKALEEQSKEYENKLAAAEEKRVADLQTLNSEWTAKYNEMISVFEAKLKEQQKLHEDEIAFLNAQFTEKYNETVNHYESVIAEKDDRHAFELAQKAEEYRRYIDELNSVHEKSIQMLNEEKKAEIAEVERKIEVINAECENRIAESERRIEEINAECDNKIAESERRIEENNAECENKIAELTQKFTSEREDAIRRAVTESEAKRSRAEAETEKIRKDAAYKLAVKNEECAEIASELRDTNKILKDCRKQVKSLEAENKRDAEFSRKLEESHNKDFERIKKIYQKNIASMSKGHSKKINKLNKRIENLESKLEKSKEIIRSREERIS